MIKPTTVKNHHPDNRNNIIIDVARDNSIPLLFSNPTKLISVTPIPPGKNVKYPNNIEENVTKVVNKISKLTSKPTKTK